MWEAPSLTNLLPRFCVTSHPMTRAALSMATVGPLAFAHPLLECSPYSSRCRTRRNIGSRFPCIYFPCKLPPRALTLWVYPVSKAAVKPSADSSSIRRLWRLPPLGLSTGTVTGPSTSTVTGRDFSTVTGRDFSSSTVTGPCSPLSRVPATPWRRAWPHAPSPRTSLPTARAHKCRSLFRGGGLLFAYRATDQDKVRVDRSFDQVRTTRGSVPRRD